MAVTPSSRYTQITDSNGRASVQRKARINSRYSTLVSVQGQSFQDIAAKWLGNASLYWRIADLNPQVLYPDEIPMGTRLRIPSV